ncbi:NAD(P)/FAD-dependent oxidoreductase [Novosphingobium album (ex Hu et al. 2023)]|uniref:FAD-binding oxidoreductase n=1 Tax=Novosphingobium album (ex Hu et al. 2023) TaxID=2930093 RepID=A0ABT0B783_9SPHN|nr:FAD-dependent oxidoreductase [Novosphingobium album (ex Hu et al. 2023)]MCJ2180936.1 FAD-binding oxidoreductase [Novosphingobium album (ex Hu et al. 2023)]
MKLMSYWHDNAPPFAGGAEGPFGGSADVVVVGGGFTGGSAALALAKKGARVVLCEADVIGSGASGRNGGMCNNGFAQDYRMLAATLGNERANTIYRAFDAGVDTVERIVREEGIDCGFARTGKLKLAARPEHYDKLARTQEVLAREVDPDTFMISREGLKDEVGTDRFFGGMVFAKSGSMHMGQFVRGLAEAAARHGAQIWEHTPMTGLRQTANGWQVTTPRGTIEAKQVLLASGISRTGPLGWVRRRIVPVGAFIIATEPLSQEQVDHLLPRRRMAVDTKNLVNYFRILPDNRLLYGGRARFAVSNEKSDVKSGAILKAAMADTFPHLADVRIDYCWGGMVDMTRDRLPRAGEKAPGLFYSMGYSGHGTQMSTLMGQIMAEVMDGQPDLNPWRDFDWPAIPGHFGKPWFLPIIGAYFRLKDKLS